MNSYAIINLINSVLALVITLIIFSKKGIKPVQITYAFYTLLISIWTFLYFVWAIQSELTSSIFWLQAVEYPVCFIHIAFFNFVLIYSGQVKRYHFLLLAGYLLSFVFVLINMNNGFYDLSNMRSFPPFMFWPHASSLTPSLFIAQLFYVTLGLNILKQFGDAADGLDRRRIRYLTYVAIIGWTGGMTNWFYFYDSTPIPPIGNPALSLYLLATFYLLFKHDILRLNLVIKRAFIYAFLTLSIAVVFAIFTVLSERYFRYFLGYNSIVTTIIFAAFISVLFNPLRIFITNFVEKYLFGKDILRLSSENEQIKTHLRHQDHMKTVATLAAGMAHEIKNPITTIKTFTRFLPERYDEPEFRSKFIRIVTDEVDRINNIVLQLLEFARPKDLELKFEPIVDILNETVDLLSNNFLNAKVEVIKDFQINPKIYVDKGQLTQAFVNITLNAIQAMPNGGTFKISTTPWLNSHLKISFQDSGEGIPQDKMNQIFEPFYTTKETGTGLGLSIVHGIIKEHGGQLKVESEKGHGAEFTVLFKSC